MRLQQACDAGALAGRKFLTDTTNDGVLDTTANNQANAFFDNNFHTGWFMTTGTTRTYTKTSDSQVLGNASVILPMTIMAMFGQKTKTLAVTCQARYDVPDTDVMFVLDTTGSMSCLPTDPTTCATSATSKTVNGQTIYLNPEKSGSKLQAVRDSVKSFYETLAASIDTSTTHIRYGFVPYSSTVNVGAEIMALSSNYMVSNASYQSRTRASTPESSSSNSVQKTNTSSSTCSGYTQTRTPANGYDSSGQATQVTATYNGNNKCTVVTTTYLPNWTYQQVSFPVSSYIATLASGGSVTDPTKVTGDTSTWNGCIEERKTTPGLDSTSDFDLNNLPPDLDPDLAPTSEETRWRPQWPDVVYGRNFKNSSSTYTSTSNVNATGEAISQPDSSATAPNYGGTKFVSGGFSVCPNAASHLQEMSESAVMSYVNALYPHGGTYHDIGMIWGTRMLSPNGVFKQYTQAWPGHDQPNRVIVFLTDGEMAPDNRIYGAYGIEYFDQRVMGSTSGTLKDYHNARFLTECSAAKARNISVWVVAVGQSLTDQLTQCATNSNQALYAGTGADLTSAFQTIAKQVAQLRISK